MALNKIIVIPIYKQVLSVNEFKALRQCFAVLYEFPVCFMCGQNFDFSNYVKLIPPQVTYTIERFNDKHFTSLIAYNNLLLSIKFYKRFRKYTFLLIYQLDAWVFKNELNYWCQKGFAYIGAPWYEGWGLADEKSRFLAVGNGGFSLRRVSAHIDALKKYRYKILPWHYYNVFKRNPSFKTLKGLVTYLFTYKIPNPTYHWCNEDVFFGRIAPRLFKNFTTPDVSVALRFSVEVNPSLHVNKNNLPFGCHAWERFQPEFWKNFIVI
jgi:hypothetical protein